jgi:hypothetical protein
MMGVSWTSVQDSGTAVDATVVVGIGVDGTGVVDGSGVGLST